MRGLWQRWDMGLAQVELESFDLVSDHVNLGEALSFCLKIKSLAKVSQPLIIDFILHHRLANGKTSPKVFKWRNLALGARKHLSIQKRHRMKPITTRKYYTGGHRVEIVINGKLLCARNFDLVI